LIHRDTLRDFTADPRLLILAAMAAVIGATATGSAWALQRLIALIANIAYLHRLGTATVAFATLHLTWTSILIPVVGCLIIGLMARFGSEKIRGHGIPEAIEAILISKSRLQFKVAVLKPLSSAISIGTGGPFGAEGPIIMTGGAIGSLFAQLFRLSSGERKTLLVAGAAAGMSATFGTPVAAMLLAVELLLFEWKPRSFVPVAVASAISAAIRPWILGSGALFPMPAYEALPSIGLLVCVGVGVVAGLMSGGLTALVYGSEDLFARLPIHWMWWPALGGVAVGIGGLIEPHALSVGYDSIAALLQGQLAWNAAARLLIVKAVIWAIALGSGTSGGVLAPLLMMGGALGLIVGHILPVGVPGIWAMIGMAAMMAGTMRSPLTAIVFALEITHRIDGLLPLAIACVAAHGTTVLLLKRSILTEKVARRGYHVAREYIVDPFESIRVSEIMAQPVDTLPAAMPVGDVVRFFTESGGAPRHKSYPVIDATGTVVGMVARADVLDWTMAGWQVGETLADRLGDARVEVGYADEQAGKLADRMAVSGIGRVPILRRGDGALVGLVARRDLLQVRARLVAQEQNREALIRFRQPAPG
jgi:H+/Cl- antiporter ClcA